MKLDQALREKILLGDGANGTCLAERGVHRQPYDLACLEAPDLVRAVHRDYLEAGADFVETNTFQANAVRFADSGIDLHALNVAGARLGREAVMGLTGRYVLGAIGPVGKPVEPLGSISQEAVFDAVREQALALAEGGVDGFILETFTDLCELRIAVEAVKSVSDLPIIASKAYIEDGEMLAEGLPSRCAQEITEMGVAAIGANCIVGPQRMLDLVRMMAESSRTPIFACPTPGLPQLVKGHIVYDASPDYFAKATGRLLEEGATIVAGCCGTTPEHIRALRKVIDRGIKRPVHARKASPTKAEKTELATTPVTELGAKLTGHKFLVAVEMDVPRGLNIDKLLAGARQLKIAGADVINISDGARARLRMNPSAVATLVQSRVGVEVTMHFSCRDRNLLAIQADLLGCHATGVRNILAVTGDPANVGDYPSATSVYDVDAIGLVRILSRLNDGVDLAGYSVGVHCGFTIAVAYNPLAFDHANELDRLKRKADAGAHLVYTQPIFDEETAQITADACRNLGLPCLIGIMPLRSARHAEFMHNEVPGIRIPDWLRAKMAAETDDSSAAEIGICEAIKLARATKTFARGLYLLPPFGNPSVAQRVMEAVL